MSNGLFEEKLAIKSATDVMKPSCISITHNFFEKCRSTKGAMNILAIQGKMSKLLKSADKLFDNPICLYIITESCIMMAAGRP